MKGSSMGDSNQMIGRSVFKEKTDPPPKTAAREFESMHMLVSFRHVHGFKLQCREWKVSGTAFNNLIRALKKKAESLKYDEVGFARKTSRKFKVCLLKNNAQGEMPIGHVTNEGFYYSTAAKDEKFTWDVLERATPML